MPIISYQDMKEKKGRVSQALLDTADLIDNLTDCIDVGIDGSVLIDLKNRLDHDDFKVLVIGRFKSGKSTFINALMGKKVLPTSPNPCTATINEVTYGREESATLYFKNPLPKEISENIDKRAEQHLAKYKGKEIPPIDLDIDELEEYVVIPAPEKDQEDSVRESPYDRVVLKYPIELCHNGITIIDSPGLDENGTRTKVTEEYLKHADAIIYAFRCSSIAGDKEMKYIDQILTLGYKDIFFICNAIDLVPEEEKDRLIKWGRKALLPLTSLGEDGIFFINSAGALKARRQKDYSKLASTGIEEFEEALSEYLRNNKGKAKLSQIINPFLDFIDIKLRKEYIETCKNSLTSDTKEKEENLKKALEKLNMAKEQKKNIGKKINTSIWELNDCIVKSMNSEYEDIIKKIPKVVESMELENHMGINPFKQKSTKEALEKEIIENLDEFVQKEMVAWVRNNLKAEVESHIDKLQKKIGQNIDEFYANLDEFRYISSGVEKPKDISGLSRVSATILGTILGGPTFAVIGASQGLGGVLKSSAITIGLSAALAWFTPMGITAISAITVVAGIFQFVTGGQTLTDKYKKKLKEEFITALKNNREKVCIDYARNIVDDIRIKMNYIEVALDNEVDQTINKVDALKKIDADSKEEKERKLAKLKEFEENLLVIKNNLMDVSKSLD